MKQPVFTGAATAIVTPFFNGAIHFEAFGRLIDFQLESGINAIVVCGTTGEAATMTYHEQMRAITYCVERVNGRIPVIAGGGSNSTEHAASLSKDVSRAGADGVLVVTPYYNKATQAGLIRHYNIVADAAEKPVILYNVPSRTGVNISPETYVALAEHPNINGVKEAGGNMAQVQRTRNLCPADFFIWSGNDEETAAICLLGGVGVISVVANVIPGQMHRLASLCLAHQFAEAAQLQLELKELCDAMFCEVNPIPVKTALNLMGFEAGDLRLPLCPPSEASLQRVNTALRRYGLLKSV